MQSPRTAAKRLLLDGRDREGPIQEVRKDQSNTRKEHSKLLGCNSSGHHKETTAAQHLNPRHKEARITVNDASKEDPWVFETFEATKNSFKKIQSELDNFHTNHILQNFGVSVSCTVLHAVQRVPRTTISETKLSPMFFHPVFNGDRSQAKEMVYLDIHVPAACASLWRQPSLFGDDAHMSGTRPKRASRAHNCRCSIARPIGTCSNQDAGRSEREAPRSCATKAKRRKRNLKRKRE